MNPQYPVVVRTFSKIQKMIIYFFFFRFSEYYIPGKKFYLIPPAVSIFKTNQYFSLEIEFQESSLQSIWK